MGKIRPTTKDQRVDQNYEKQDGGIAVIYLFLFFLVVNIVPFIILGAVLIKMWNIDFYGVKNERNHFRK